MSEVRYLVHPYETYAPERIWVWGWEASCDWQEQTWQLEDEPISTMPYVRADRFEELEAKLAKAVDALEQYSSIPLVGGKLARDTIAELKGEKL